MYAALAAVIAGNQAIQQSVRMQQEEIDRQFQEKSNDEDEDEDE